MFLLAKYFIHLLQMIRINSDDFYSHLKSSSGFAEDRFNADLAERQIE